MVKIADISTVPTQLQDAAFRFLKLKSGKGSKHPAEVGWQSKKYNYKNVETWLANGVNYGVIMGANNLIVVDADKPEIERLVNLGLPETFSVLTGSGKRHYYFFCKECKDFPKGFIGLENPDEPHSKENHFGEIRVNEVYVVGPGSVHPDTGDKYEIDKDIPIATVDKETVLSVLRDFIAPAELLPKDANNGGKTSSITSSTSILDVFPGLLLKKTGNCQYSGTHPIHGSTTGNNFCINTRDNLWYCFRHNTGGNILPLIAQKEGVIKCGEKLEGENYKKVLKVAKNQFGVTMRKEEKISQGEIITRDCEQNIKDFIIDQYGEYIVVLPINDHFEVRATSSTVFTHWMTTRYRNAFNVPPQNDAVAQARIQIEAKCAAGRQFELYNRVGWDNGKIYYDLTTPDWQGVEIDKDGWRVVPLPPIFRRYDHQIPQVMPEFGGQAMEFLNFVNLDDDDACLFLTTVATYFIPNIPHALIDQSGEHGSGKSSNSKKIKLLCDPSKAELFGAPSDEQTAQQNAEKHWVLNLDNISKVPNWLSDFLCRVVTGEAYSRRKLYSNDDDHTRLYKRCILVNGIGMSLYRGDILDRTIIFDVPVLTNARAESEISKKWKDSMPKILGGFFTAIAGAMAKVDKVVIKDSYRMADFAHWGAALAPELGYTQDKFLTDYLKANSAKWLESITSNSLAKRIINILDQFDNSWEGSLTELYELIKPDVDAKGYVPRDKGLPPDPTRLSTYLMRITPGLRQIGIIVTKTKQYTKDKRLIYQIIRKPVIEEATAPAVAELMDILYDDFEGKACKAGVGWLFSRLTT